MYAALRVDRPEAGDSGRDSVGLIRRGEVERLVVGINLLEHPHPLDRDHAEIMLVMRTVAGVEAVSRHAIVKLLPCAV